MSVIEATAGSRAASDRALVEVYWPRAYRFAAMVTRNDQESADIAQEALLRVWRNLGRFDSRRGTFESWLWRIVLSVARDQGRAAGRRAALLERVRRLAPTRADEDVENAALNHLGDGELLAAIRRLPKRARTLIALRFGAHLSYAEVAEQMGISEAAALMGTRRALWILRAQIKSKEQL